MSDESPDRHWKNMIKLRMDPMTQPQVSPLDRLTCHSERFASLCSSAINRGSNSLSRSSSSAPHLRQQLLAQASLGLISSISSHVSSTSRALRCAQGKSQRPACCLRGSRGSKRTLLEMRRQQGKLHEAQQVTASGLTDRYRTWVLRIQYTAEDKSHVGVPRRGLIHTLYGMYAHCSLALTAPQGVLGQCTILPGLSFVAAAVTCHSEEVDIGPCASDRAPAILARLARPSVSAAATGQALSLLSSHPSCFPRI